MRHCLSQIIRFLSSSAFGPLYPKQCGRPREREKATKYLTRNRSRINQNSAGSRTRPLRDISDRAYVNAERTNWIFPIPLLFFVLYFVTGSR